MDEQKKQEQKAINLQEFEKEMRKLLKPKFNPTDLFLWITLAAISGSFLAGAVYLWVLLIRFMAR